MSFAQFFAAYWWLMFPVFGMLMAFIGMFQTERRSNQTIDLIKSYVDQGKDPPPELLKLVAQQSDWDRDMTGMVGANSRGGKAWTFVVFLALAAGFGTGYYFMRAEEWAFAFLIVAVTMGVMALGALLILIFGRKS